MAATNVQAFSGDVEVASNLAVDTNVLFVDSVNNRVGIGKTDPGNPLDVNGVIKASSNMDSPLFYNSGGTTQVGSAYNEFTELRGGGSTRLSINNSEVARLTADGLGIGATAPATKLHLLGVGNGSGPRLRFETLNNGNEYYTLSGTEIGGIQFGADDATWSTTHMSSEIVGIHYNPNYSGAQGILAFKTSSTQGASPTEKMRIRYDGNVGIGTNDPGSLLSFYKDYPVPSFNAEPAINQEQGITFRSDLNSFSAGGIAWSTDTVHDTAKIWFQPASYSAVSSGSAGAHGKLNFGVGYSSSLTNTPRMTITSGNRVGIGSTIPARPLDVDGMAYCRLFASNFGDSYIEPGYALLYIVNTTQVWIWQSNNNGNNTYGMTYFKVKSGFPTQVYNFVGNNGHAYHDAGYIKMNPGWPATNITWRTMRYI